MDQVLQALQPKGAQDMPFEEIVKQVTETIQKEASARAVFGEPTKLDTHIVVPVATVSIELGGGGGGGTRKPGAEIARIFGGGGGGLKVVARPVGLIHEQDGAVVFTRIEAEKPIDAPAPLAERIVSALTPRPREEKKSAEKH
jgi:uncharacterized spore protein YtfJ